MEDVKTVDARGLACPQPVILTLDAMKGMPGGKIVVLADCGTSKENVERLATKNGWKVDVEDQPDGSCRLLLSK